MLFAYLRSSEISTKRIFGCEASNNSNKKCIKETLKTMKIKYNHEITAQGFSDNFIHKHGFEKISSVSCCYCLTCALVCAHTNVRISHQDDFICNVKKILIYAQIVATSKSVIANILFTVDATRLSKYIYIYS